jgi:uncharacterized protein (TIGR02117 family)
MRAIPLRVLLCAFAFGCAGAPTTVNAPANPELAIFVVPQGGHTGIAVRRADIPAGLWPEKEDFPDALFLEVGWGDRDYYMAQSPGLWLALKAALLPTPSVLHVVGVRESPARHFWQSEVIEIPVSRAGLERLLRYVHDAFDRAGADRAAVLGPGQSPGSLFYPGRESFHLLRTCNVWTAGALRAADLPVRDAITVEAILEQVRPLRAR